MLLTPLRHELKSQSVSPLAARVEYLLAERKEDFGRKELQLAQCNTLKPKQYFKVIQPQGEFSLVFNLEPFLPRAIIWPYLRGEKWLIQVSMLCPRSIKQN
jgi:hypothetical protein